MDVSSEEVSTKLYHSSSSLTCRYVKNINHYEKLLCPPYGLPDVLHDKMEGDREHMEQYKAPNEE